MYNRYIPQPDGSYRRNRMPESNQTAAHRPQPQQPCPSPQPEPEPPKPVPPQRRPCQQQRSHRPTTPPKEPHGDTSINSFLKRLLPKDFDTGDLIIVLLLLLMAGDCPDDRNNALLTLALYFIM